MAMGYFKEIHFIFLMVGHTKNAADRLFNSLKQEYWKQNLFTFDGFVRTLDKLSLLTIHPTMAEDFLDYSKLLDGLYRPLMGNIKTNLLDMSATLLVTTRVVTGRVAGMSSKSNIPWTLVSQINVPPPLSLPIG